MAGERAKEARVYNFIWTMCHSIPWALPVQHQQDNEVNRRVKPSEGVILFPALLTPLVHVETAGDGSFALLIATKDELTPEMVNHQLKLSQGLQPWKPYRVRTLFGGVTGAGASSRIGVQRIGEVDDGEETILESGAGFSGVLQRDFAAALGRAGCTKLYQVLIRDAKGCIASACPEMHPSAADIVKSYEKREGNDGIKYCCTLEPPLRVAVKYRRPELANPETDRDIIGSELHDTLIAQMTRRRFADNGARHLPPGGGHYCFTVDPGDVDPNHFDGKAPIQSYHPLYVYPRDAFTYANVGHLSDVHVNSRWQILKRTPARVIEGDAAHSPTVGSRLSDNNTSFVSVLQRLVAADSQLIIVGGDLIDHIRNAHWDEPVANALAGDVWHALNMDQRSGGYTMSNYPAGVDLIAFYSLIMKNACVKKPVYVLTGNHDCYFEAFGISPRLKVIGRGNPGIPADLNLTMYEALLGFGRSGAFLAEFSMPFKPPWFEWFYTVLTPFRDYAHKLPRQALVACGWGYGEDVMHDWGSGQGVGHLGRSDDAVTPVQLKLIQNALKDEATHKVILATHFTFASFRDDVPNFEPAGQRKVGELQTSDWSNARNTFDWGTFEKSHDPVHSLLREHKMIVVTGHTHRRGVYRITKKSDEALSVELHVAPVTGLEWKDDGSGACIVVSDSAGPYPRSNRQGEFCGWGSDIPAGTLVVTDKEKGFVANVIPVQAARERPRAAVAVDYVDLKERAAFPKTSGIPDDTFMMIAIVRSKNFSAKRRFVYMPFAPRLSGMGIVASELAFVSLTKERTVRTPVERALTESRFDFEVSALFDASLDDWLLATPSGQRFVSVKLALAAERLSEEQHQHLASQYNWDDWWHFDVEVDAAEDDDEYNDVLPPPRPYRETAVTWYCVSRVKRKLKVKGGPGWLGLADASYDDVPDWGWREMNFPEVYGRRAAGPAAEPPRPPTGRRPRRRVS